jgi:membrane protease YdiL (CAAX protease family)
VVAGVGIRLTGGRAGAGPHAARLTGAGLAAGCTGLALAILLSLIAGTAHAMGSGGASIALLVAGAGITLLQTGAEELYFRGWLQPHLETALGLPSGVSVTALAFAALHFVSGTFGVVSFANMALGGLWFGLLAQRSGGLALPIGAHFGWNWAEEMLFGATPNPGISHYTALFDWDLTGAAIWGGSTDGLNASISTTFVLVAFIIVTASWRAARARALSAAAG